MTPQDKALVQESWRLVVPIADTAARLFYDRLFEIDPRLRTLFAGVDMQRQRAKLVQGLSMVVGGLDRIEELVPTIEALGRRHAGYGVSDAHYEAVGAALLWSLEKGLGEAWSEAAAKAWTRAYALLADVMRAAAAQSTSPAPPVDAAA